jgi:RHS repeat-associated protein
MGRQLQGITGTDLNASYKYNENGLRTQKTVNGQTHEYTLLGSSVTREVIRDNAGNILWTIHYSYAGEGTPVSMNVNGTEYYYLKNAQGDITHIVDGDGNEVASYEYDAWGNHLEVTGGDIAQLNPYRYRGYRYDSETGLYYLQSRYYNPEWGRFINADGYVNTGQGIVGSNMFAYCGNNPISRIDSAGYSWRDILDFILAAGKTVAEICDWVWDTCTAPIVDVGKTIWFAFQLNEVCNDGNDNLAIHAENVVNIGYDPTINPKPFKGKLKQAETYKQRCEKDYEALIDVGRVGSAVVGKSWGDLTNKIRKEIVDDMDSWCGPTKKQIVYAGMKKAAKIGMDMIW